tara:strand:- start:1869 stop:2084 length:216 start_codon:yes stop_codon:yes gene_type:complete
MSYKLTIDRIEEDVVVCMFDEGAQIDVPLFAMPDDVGEGDVVHMLITKDEPLSDKQKVEAKELLNELLQAS